MTRTRMKKTFDCVEMKRKGAARIYEDVHGLTQEQEKVYWEQLNEEFVKRQKNRQTSSNLPLGRA